MNSVSKGHDTLMLVIHEKDGILSEYQRQLYEAALLGIDRVCYCFVCDSDANNKVDRINDMAEKLEMTCDLLKIGLLNKCFTVFDSFLSSSRVLKTNNEGFLLAGDQDFDIYKREHRNELEDRERLGKVLLNKMI